ncbi:uncharacterized protein LOC130612907 [Hydractinia symbiolongicarpus]|uniref:uncharacterized protein LOC130612907 n=1 Tax=Hydractinia symbiolongicarpus TaxID=13093 RepID=UPI00254E8C1B|nr:uncharacterized protein LOC130612907 [Hydractinia symbiolongicarpus]
MSLKRIKYMFRQRSRIAHAVLSNVTNGKPIVNRNSVGLTNLYYTISERLITLHPKWADYCLKIRRIQEPNLTHLESWLQERILASKTSYLPDDFPGRSLYTIPDQNRKNDRSNRRKDGEDQNDNQWTGTLHRKANDYNVCRICKKHPFFKCPTYKEMAPEKRFQAAKKLEMCYNCLKQDHFTSKCTSKNSCFESGCSERHHTTLHKYTCQVDWFGLNLTTTYALLDSCSQSTHLSRDVAKKLKLKTKSKIISISTINDTGNEIKVKEAKLNAKSTLDDLNVQIDQCYIVPKTHFHMPTQIYPEDISRFEHIKGIKLHNVQSGQIGILIGANVPSAHIPLDVTTGIGSKLSAIRTVFGWTLFGTHGRIGNPFVNKLHLESKESIHDVVQRLWEQDSIGNVNDRDPAPSVEDKICLHKLDLQTRFDLRKYEVPMLTIVQRQKRGLHTYFKD